MRFSYSISRNLSECLKDIIQIDNDTIITGITSNSADVKDGYLFCALSDKANEYISDAIVNGASVIIANNIKENLPESVLKIIYATPKDVYHKICSNFYKKQPKHISAVTGTNGKTSVCYFFQQICNLTNKKAASIGTLGLVINNEIFEENLLLTSPNASKLHSLLYNLYCNDINYVALEASSHGLDQQRMHSVKLESAVFTNLSHDHLDYHNDMESYFKAKLKLFTEILPSIGNVILNIDDEYSHRIKSLIKQKNIITYGSRNADIQILEQNPTPCGQNIKIKAFNKFLEVKLNIFGKFQAYNLLAAVGLALANGVDIYKIDYEKIKSPPGRMEYIENNRNLKVFIDYAHTPDGLQNALLSLKWHFPDLMVTVVFGCGGDRDPKKRPIMGEIAFKLSDKIIICDDNPRSEDPSKIRQDISLKCNGKAIEIGDRKKAIEYAILNSTQDDVILIAGRGHENIQKFANYELQINDAKIVKEI